MRPATIRDNIIQRISLVMFCCVIVGWAQGAVAATDIPPKVKLTAPANHAVFAAPANITLTATASDKDGTIKRVEFFNGTKRLATVKSAPYTFNWTNVKAGKYTLTAVATDNGNVKTTSHAVHIIVDILPKVSLTSPANNATFNAPATIPLTATAKDSDGKVAKVDFYQGTSLIATVTSKPYTFTLNNVQGGNYSFTAVATDNRGESTTSSPITITVTAVPDIPPTISLTTNGATFKAPASVTLTASANDVDGTVAKVDFFQGNTPIASITPPTPFIFTVNNLAQGAYTFTAIATDDKGATTTSNQATITVTPAQAQLFYIYTDQLNTPRVITDQTNKVVWRWDNQDPFGANVPDEDPDGDGIKFTCNLRFPGQYFDKETNTHYNYFRDYEPNTGRYVESDPIGLRGGISTYAYVASGPLVWSDPFGLDSDGSGFSTRYGNWCGKNWSGGREGRIIPQNPAGPIDSVDECCMTHDYCYAKYECDTCPSGSRAKEGKKECDMVLVSCLDALKGKPPQAWPKPPRPENEANAYFFCQKAKFYFK